MKSHETAAVVYKFPCGTGEEKGAREMLGDLFEKALFERFGGDLILAAEAYSEARVDQLAAIMEKTAVEDITYIDCDDYLNGMIGVMSEWLNEVRDMQSTG